MKNGKIKEKCCLGVFWAESSLESLCNLCTFEVKVPDRSNYKFFFLGNSSISWNFGINPSLLHILRWEKFNKLSISEELKFVNLIFHLFQNIEHLSYEFGNFWRTIFYGFFSLLFPYFFPILSPCKNWQIYNFLFSWFNSFLSIAE